MQTTSTRFRDKMQKILEEAIEERMEVVANGTGIETHSEYRSRVGEIRGLRLALEFCDEVASEMEKERL